MEISRTLASLRAARAGFSRLALVPTMGALHEGHLALVDAARASGAAVAASIFVNPLQFGPNEDLSRYPRDEADDLAKLESAGCDLVWLPDMPAMYPDGDATVIMVGGPAERWEGAARPGHFRGVATVVAKLFGQIRPESAYFGEKDWQQVQVIRRMAQDLLLPVEIVAVPTRRDLDGLALSSRNRYLDPGWRKLAPELYASLRASRVQLRDGAATEAALEAGRARLAAAGFKVDYLAVVDAETLEPLAALSRPARLIAAAQLGPVRLLDNILI